MRTIRPLLSAFALLLAALVPAQHTPLTTQYLFNGLLINPAYAGSREALTANLTYRQQWVGFEGAPVTQIFSVHSPLNKKHIALGLTVYNDRIGVSRETGFMTNYAYRVPLGAGKLSMGLGVGLKMIQADWTQVRTTTAGDIEFANDSRGTMRPDFSTGAYYSDKRFFLGLSLPFILTQHFDAQTENVVVTNDPHQYQPMLIGGMLLSLDQNLKLKPSVLLRKAGGEPMQADLNMNAIWKDRFWLGASYRTGDAICLSLEVLPTPQFRIGYAYDLGISALNPYHGGSHELMLQYEFGFRIRAKDPRYFLMMGRGTLLLLSALAVAQAMGQVAYNVEPLDIRPAATDFAPVLVDSSLVFASIRSRAQAISYTDPETHKPLADLYRITLRNGKPGHPQLMDGSLCTKLNDGPATFSPSGDTICFTRNGATKGGADVLSLFFATRHGKDWSDAVPFTYNGSDFSTMGAAFSPDGQRLYFASDRPGGQGGMDLYVCRRSDSGWSTPLNLGRTVNSSANEAYPSMQRDGKLYFASDRSGGMGKLDLYSSALAYGEFDTPIALPAPVNSSGNDLGWTASADGMSGYFSSDRNGTDEIFHFSAKPELFRDCKEQEKNSYCFHFEDAGTTQADTLPLRYVWDFGDSTKLAAVSTDHCYTKPGTYTVKLNLMDTLSQSVYFNQVTYDLTVSDVEQANINALDSAGTGQAVVFDTSHTNLPEFTAREVHWDFGDSAAASGGNAEHAFAQAGIFTVKLDLIGGPDGQGGFLHHCSTRAMKVIDGINVEAGFSNAVASSDHYHFEYQELPSDAYNLSETDDKDVSFTVEIFTSASRIDLNDPRFMRIRLNYPVVERYVPSLRLYTYSIATGTTPQAVYRAFSTARAEGFAASIVKRMPKDKPIDMDQIDKLPLDKLNNAMVRISTVRFRSGERSFDPSFNTVLDQLISVLVKYPTLELVIEAHTDDVGTDESNMLLSQGRAEAVTEYLTAHGVPAERLRPLGFGEDRPIAPNTTAAGREQNRRVEFRLNVPGTANAAHP